MNSENKKGCPVIRFEIGCTNIGKTNNFYTSIFGWIGTASPMASYLNTNADEDIQGHITSLGHEPQHYITFYIQVSDINAYLLRIEAAGGKKIVGPVPLPDGKKFAWFSDPDNNIIGLITG